MKICFFSKYPPIEGGVSSRSYWLARALGEKGVEVHIITNALETKEELREKIDFENPEDLANYQPENVYVHSLDSWAPNLKYSTLAPNDESRLVSLALKVIEHYQCDLIDSYYYFPYGVSAYFAKKIIGKSLILRHAGSDINRVVNDKTFWPLFQKIFSDTDLIMTHQAMANFFQELNIPVSKLFFDFNFGIESRIDSKYFNPHVSPIDLKKYGLDINSKTPIITYMGKISPWKGIYELVEAADKINNDFFLLFVAGGSIPAVNEFKNHLMKFPNLQGKYCILGFVPPWEIPPILRRSRCLVQLERDFPIPHHAPIQPIEAMAAGTCPIISKEIYERPYMKLLSVEKDKNVLIVNPKNIKKLKDLLERVIKDEGFAQNIGQKAAKAFDKEAFPDAIPAMIKVYESILQNTKSFRRCLEELKRVIIRHLNN